MKRESTQTIINRLTKEGYTASIIELIGSDNNINYGVKVDTDYEGLYPGRYQFNTLDYIRKTYKQRNVESRGHYTAIFIY